MDKGNGVMENGEANHGLGVFNLGSFSLTPISSGTCGNGCLNPHGYVKMQEGFEVI